MNPSPSDQPAPTSVSPASNADARRELAALAAEFLTASLARKVDIQTRRHELRADVAASGVGELGASSLASLQELERHLTAQLAAIGSRKLSTGSIGSAGGPGGAGLDPLQTIEHNRHLDSDFDVQAIRAQLRAVTAEIARRQS